MPLRSVEAATRDDAIAAAREQFGPMARVVGIRRVRSGGVLGFFATERYVAEVDPENPTGARPAQRRPRPRDTEPVPTDRTPLDRPSVELQDKVKELVGLLGTESAEPVVPTYSRASVHRAPSPRAGADDLPAAFPATTASRSTITAGLLKSAQTSPAPWIRSAGPALAVGMDEDDESDEDGDAPDPGESLPPSPFTAALARMVAGDRSVREAVREALEEPAADRAPTDDAPAGSEPVARSPIEKAWSEWIGQATAPATPVDTGAAHQDTGAQHREEETPVGEQEVVPPSLRAALEAEEAPVWGEPEPAPAPVSPREEEIAAVLRAALAQGHSDETLADILRKVLAGVSPQAALPVEPPVPAEPAAVPAAAFESSAFPEPALEHALEPAVEGPPWAADPEPLWAEVSPADRDPVRADAPIWAEVVLQEPAPAPPEFTARDVTEDDAADDARLAEERPEPAAMQAAGTGTRWDDDATAEAAADAVAEATDTVEAEAAEPFTAVLAAAEEPLLARTASDPAPLPLDATAVLPPLSLLPPRPSSRLSSRPSGGLPPVPPPARPPVPPSARTASGPAAPGARPPAGPVPPRTLATVTRLPVAPLHDSVEAAAEAPVERPAEPVYEVVSEVVSAPALEPAISTSPEARPEPPAEVPAPPAGPARRPSDVVGRLRALGLPEWLLGDSFGADAAAHGTYAALTRALGNGLPHAPELPTDAGEVLLVVGPGVETLVAARSLAASLRLDPDRVQWASRGELAGLAPAGSRMTTVETAIERRQESAGAGTLTVVAVDAPLRTDGHWMAQMLAIWTPATVWAVVDATRKPEDVEPWLDGLPRVDALMVQDTDLSADPAAVLQRIAIPVALLDGVLATPHRWASVLCERLEKQQG